MKKTEGSEALSRAGGIGEGGCCLESGTGARRPGTLAAALFVVVLTNIADAVAAVETIAGDAAARGG